VRRYPTDSDLPPIPDPLIRGGGMAGVESQIELFEISFSFLESLTSVKPVIMVLEDLHWSDLDSLKLLRYLARQSCDVPLLIIATYRDDEISPDNPMFTLLPSITREANTTRLHLRPLADSSFAELLIAHYELDRPTAEQLALRLNHHAEGNPLYFWELLRGLEEDGTIDLRSGRIQLKQLESIRVPSLLLQLIGRRMNRLPPEHRGILEIAAVIGPEIEIDLWQEVTELDDDSLSDVIDHALESHILVEGSTGSSVRFSHSLLLRALYQQISPLKRRRMHQRIADKFLELNDPDENIVAHHMLMSGDERAADWHIKAGERALSAYAHQAAAERFSRAAELLSKDESRQNERGWLLYRAARGLRFSDATRGLKYFEMAEEIAREVGDSVLAAYALVDQGYLHGNLGNVRKSYECVLAGNEAIEDLPGDHMLSDSIRNWVAEVVLRPTATEKDDQGFLDRLGGRFNPRRPQFVQLSAIVGLLDDAFELGEPMRAQLASITDPDHHILVPYAELCSGLGIAHSRLGELDATDAAFAEAREAMRHVEHRVVYAAIVYLTLQHYVLAYRLDHPTERRELAAEAEKALAESGQSILPGPSAQMTKFALLWLEGHWSDLQSEATRARSIIFRENQKHIDIALGHIARARGEFDAAWAHIFQALPDGVATEHLDAELHVALETQNLAAMTALDQNEPGNAERWISTMDEWLQWSGAVRGQSELELLRSRLHEQSGNSNLAMRFANHAVHLARSPRQPLAIVRSLRHLGELHLSAGRIDRALECLNESVTLADACAVPYEQALTRMSLADALFRSGNRQRATSLIRAVERTARELEAEPMLARVREHEARFAQDTTGQEIGLTVRELEVLKIASQGLADPDIADQLSIARRTVNTHLTAIYRKLDVSNRTEAASRARQLGLIND
jgi:DNA-binding NarL/FixJ family response regulator